MGEFNKTTAAVLAGAVVTIIAVFLPAQYRSPEVIGAAQTIITALLVYLVPNRPPAP